MKEKLCECNTCAVVFLMSFLFSVWSRALDKIRRTKTAFERTYHIVCRNVVNSGCTRHTDNRNTLDFVVVNIWNVDHGDGNETLLTRKVRVNQSLSIKRFIHFYARCRQHSITRHINTLSAASVYCMSSYTMHRVHFDIRVGVCSSRTGAVVRRANCQRHRRSRADGSPALLCRLTRYLQGTAVHSLALIIGLRNVIAHLTFIIMTLMRRPPSGWLSPLCVFILYFGGTIFYECVHGVSS